MRLPIADPHRQPESKLPLLKFPPEILNRLYNLVYVSPDYIGGHNFYQNARGWRNLSFARSCRQIYDESADIFFAQNGFEFDDDGTCARFLHAIGPRRRRLLQRLRYISYSMSPFPYKQFSLIGDCENLQHVDIQIRVLPLAGASWIAQRVRDGKKAVFSEDSTIEWEEPIEVAMFGSAALAPTNPLRAFQLRELEDRRTRIQIVIANMQAKKRQAQGTQHA